MQQVRGQGVGTEGFSFSKKSGTIAHLVPDKQTKTNRQKKAEERWMDTDYLLY